MAWRGVAGMPDPCRNMRAAFANLRTAFSRLRTALAHLRAAFARDGLDKSFWSFAQHQRPYKCNGAAF